MPGWISLLRIRVLIAVEWLLVLLLAPLGGCMIFPLDRPEYEKVTGHVGCGGFDHSSLEVGIGWLQYERATLGHNPANQTKHYALALRREFPDSGSHYAIEASYWASMLGICTGVSMAYHTDFATGGGLYLRPDVGLTYPLGPVWFRASIGWNIRVVGEAPGELNSPYLSARFSMPLDTTAPSHP